MTVSGTEHGPRSSGDVADPVRVGSELDPVHPSENSPYTICRTRLVDRSRSVARSGIIPMYQKTSETVA